MTETLWDSWKSLFSQSLKRVVTHYLYMVRISKGCSSNWKLLQNL